RMKTCSIVILRYSEGSSPVWQDASEYLSMMARHGFRNIFRAVLPHARFYILCEIARISFPLRLERFAVLSDAGEDGFAVHDVCAVGPGVVQFETQCIRI